VSCVCRRAGSYAPELNAGPARHSDIDIALAILSGECENRDHQERLCRRKARRKDHLSSASPPLKEELGPVLADAETAHRPTYSQFDEYTGAVNRLLKEIDRLSKNDLRSSEAHIQNFVSIPFLTFLN